MSTEPTTASAGDGTADGPSQSRGATVTLFVVAVVIIVFYFAVKLYLMSVLKHNVEERDWSRYTYVAGGLDSIVSIAVGWLFGREVHRKAYEAAERSAAHARASAHAACQADRESRKELSDARTAHISAVQKADYGQSLAKTIKAIMSVAHQDPNISGAAPNRVQLLEHVATQVEQAVSEFFPDEPTSSP